jgi:uncharacterized protein YprB with RNaseH-like and TPR domain
MSKKLHYMLQRMKKDDIVKMAGKRCAHGHSLFEHPSCMEKELRGGVERIGILDIESSNLNASFGYIISYCIKELDGNIIERVITEKEIRDGVMDKNLVQELIEDLQKFTRIITYYGMRFDIPFIRTRAVRHGLDFPLYRAINHTDIYFTMKHKFKIHSNRLGAVCEFFDIPAKDHMLKPDIWQAAMAGNKAALEYILQHNREDVDSTELLYKKVMGFSPVKNTSI